MTSKSPAGIRQSSFYFHSLLMTHVSTRLQRIAQAVTENSIAIFVSPCRRKTEIFHRRDTGHEKKFTTEA